MEHPNLHQYTLVENHPNQHLVVHSSGWELIAEKYEFGDFFCRNIKELFLTKII